MSSRDGVVRLEMADSPLPKDAAALKSELEAIKNFPAGLLEPMTTAQVDAWVFLRNQRTLAPRLFHYTSAEGFAGILSTRELWLTHSSFLNDALEREYQRDVVTDFLRSLPSINDAIRTFAIGYVSRYLSGIDECVGSFAGSGDQLSLWRAYGSAGGYSIGFETNDLVRIAGLPHVLPVEYERDHQLELLGLAAKSLIESEGWATSPANEHDRGFVVSVLMSTVAQSFKSIAFRDEQEARIIRRRVVPRWPIHFRTLRGLLTPYIKQPLWNEAIAVPIHEVFCSPLGEAALLEKAATMFVNQMGLPAEVRRPSARLRH